MLKHQEVFVGRVGVIDELKELANGNCVLNFSVAESVRVKRGEEWVDGTPIWTNISIFGDEARNLLRSVKPGTQVVVVGTRQAREYTTRDTQEKRVVQSVVAEQVGVAITKFNYVESIGNINYSQEGTSSAPAQKANTKPQAKNNTAPKQDDPFASAGLGNDDPFATNSSDPFGGDDDDPFGLNA